jgi:hypothetical protein
MTGAETCKAVARAVHDATVGAFDLELAYGLVCVPGPRAACVRDDDNRYDVTARPVRQHGYVVHEVAHDGLRLHGEDDPEDAVGYTAGALMLHRQWFDRGTGCTMGRRSPSTCRRLFPRRGADSTGDVDQAEQSGSSQRP